MDTVRQILDAKGRDVWSISPQASVFSALEIMADKNIGALVVLDGGKLHGIISERDYARKVILRGRTSLETPVREIMTSEVIAVAPEQTVEDCMALMTDNRVRHLPVLEDDEVVGLISIGDVVSTVIGQQKFLIRQLETYITTGSR